VDAPTGGRPKRSVRACADCGGKSTSAWWGVGDSDDTGWMSYTINSAPANEPLWCDGCVTAKRKSAAPPRAAIAAASPRSDVTDKR